MMEHQNNGEPGNRNSATPTVSLGTMLREAREHLNLSVAEVAAQIKFAPRQIEALESDDYKHLPEIAFLRGFVRSYAKILNLDAQPLLALLPQEKAAVAELIPASVGMPYPVDNTSQRQNLILLGAALLLAVIAVGFSVWHFTNPLRQPTAAKIESPLPLPAEKQASPEPAVQKLSATEPSRTAETKQEAAASQATLKSDKARNEASDMTSAAATQSPVRATKPNANAVATDTQSSAQAPKTNAPTSSQPSATAAQPSAAVAQPSPQAAKPKAPASTQSSTTAAQSSVPAVKNKAVQTETQAQTQTQTQTQTQNQSNGSGNVADTGTSSTVLKLVFDEESWAEIKDKDGNLISSQINPRGSELNVKGQLPLSLVIGHAATTHVFKNGQPVDMTPYINSSSEVARFTLE